MINKILIFFCGILTVIGCSRSFKAPARLPQPSDSLYTARAALKIYGTQPEKALTIIDSALAVGNVSPFRAQFVRAKIYANSLEGLQRDRAIALCEELLKQDSTQVVDQATAANRNNVLDVMMDACRKNNDDEKWLRYAIERAQLSRDQGMETESLRMEAEIRAAMTRVGRREEGMIKLEQVIGALEKGAPSVDRFDISRHYLNDLFSAYANGLSFPAYINEMRMQDALRMLENEPEVSIGLIADAVGFTPANFREQFKKEFGMTPTEYRQNL